MNQIDSKSKVLFPFLALVVLIFLLYSNTFKSPFIFDDNPNILANYPLHITNLMPETLWRTFFAYPFKAGKIYRPLPCFSIALNWYLGKTNTLGYHIFNILVHFGVSIFLYLTIYQLLLTPALREKYTSRSRYFIALLASIFWAVNPIQSQAVTYIIQRMASMATLFYLIAIYYYIKARLTDESRYRMLMFCFLFYCMALGSKENAVMLPASLLIVEYIFFFRHEKQTNTIFLKILGGATILIMLAGIIFLFRAGILTHLFEYAHSRPFTHYQRLLTEPRVIFLYLSLIFYPLPSRLSIDHDFALSTSFFHPWTTLPAILGILVLLAFALKYHRKWPLISFAILFYLINHLVESSIIPLELIFEHRNYLPSLFLFVPLASGGYYLLNYYSRHNRVIHVCLILFISFLIISVGIGTYIRNMAYSSSETLWTDTLKKDPHSSRAFSNLGIIIGWKKEKTLKTLQQAIAFNLGATKNVLYMKGFEPAIFSNTGGVYYNYRMYDKAIYYLKHAVELSPNYFEGRMNLAKSYMMKGDYQKALEQMDYVVKNDIPHSRNYNVQGLALLWLNRPQEALVAFHNAMNILINKKIAYYSIGAAMSRCGYYKKARWFMGLAKQKEKDNLRLAFSLIENSIRANDKKLIKKDVYYLFDNFTMTVIADALNILPTERSSVPVDVPLIRPVIEKYSKDFSESLFTK